MTRAALRSRLGGPEHEARLARAAAAGSRRALAALLARHEQRVYNLCLRLTGSRDHAATATREAFVDALEAMSHLSDAEAGLGPCLILAGRQRSIELLERQPREQGSPAVSPGTGGRGEGHHSRDALEAEQEALREANLRLAEPERAILALGRLGALSPGAMAAVMDISRDCLPELTARARLRLHEQLRATGGGPAPPAREECAQALPLMAMRDDGHLTDEGERTWLLEHLAHCGECRLRLDAMERAAAAYERWQPVAAPTSLSAETMAAAGCSTGADAAQPAKRRAARVPAEGLAAGLATLRLAARGSPVARLGSSVWGRRPWSDRAVTAGLILVVLLGLSATLAGASLVLGGGDRSGPGVARPADAGALIGPRPAPARAPTRKPRPRRAARPPKASVARPPAAVVRTPATQRPPADRAPTGVRRRRRVPTAEAVPLPKAAPSPSPRRRAPTRRAPRRPASGQPAPVQPPASTIPQTPPTEPAPCRDATGKPGPCPG